MMRRLAYLIRHIRPLARFARDNRGVSAIEFAFIAPVLITFYFGVAELTQALLADRRASHVASSIGDLVAQDDNLTAADAADIFQVGAIVMSPFDTTPLQMRVTQITSNASNAATVDWSVASSNYTKLTPGATVTPPAGVISANQYVIMAETVYTYTSPIQYFVKKPVFTKTYYLRPRRTDKVTYTP
jgi:Flp pilus assembly protein TadG